MEKNWLIRHGWTIDKGKMNFYYKGRLLDDTLVLTKKEKYEIAKFLYEYADGTEENIERALKKLMMKFVDKIVKEELNFQYAIEINLLNGKVMIYNLLQSGEKVKGRDPAVFDFTNDKSNIRDLVEIARLTNDPFMDEDARTMERIFYELVK